MARRGRPSGNDLSRFFTDSDAICVAATIAGVPQIPKELNEIGKKKWKELVKLLVSMDLITKADRDMMELYCNAYSRRHAAEAMLRKFGEILKSKQGGLYRSPYLDVSNHAAKEMQKLARSLGLDAMSRKKLGIRTTRSPRIAARDRSKGPPPPDDAD